MINFIKILCEVLLLTIPILFALPSDSFVYNYEFIKSSITIIRPALIVILFLAIIVRYIIEYHNFKLKGDNKKLIEAIKQYRGFLSSGIDEKLKEIFESLGLNEDFRVTVFLYSSTLNKFFSVGRYASAPKYNQEGRYIIDNQKEYVFQVLNDETHYKKAPKIHNGFLGKRKMQSKSMFGVPLWDDKHMNKIGVVVYQSMKEKTFRTKDVRSQFIKQTKDINSLINSMKVDPNNIRSQDNTIGGF